MKTGADDAATPCRAPEALRDKACVEHRVMFDGIGQGGT